MLPIIQREVVSRQRWLNSAAYADTLIVTQSVPGPLALNNSIIVGIHLRGIAGGLTAALGVVTPSVIVILILVGFLLPLIQENIFVQAIFYGIRPTVVALIVAAAYYLARELINNWMGISLIVVLLAFAVLVRPHPIIILLSGGLLGFLLFRKRGSTDA